MLPSLQERLLLHNLALEDCVIENGLATQQAYDT
jgi:hypothetical protein